MLRLSIRNYDNDPANIGSAHVQSEMMTLDPPNLGSVDIKSFGWVYVSLYYVRFKDVEIKELKNTIYKILSLAPFLRYGHFNVKRFTPLSQQKLSLSRSPAKRASPPHLRPLGLKVRSDSMSADQKLAD